MISDNSWHRVIRLETVTSLDINCPQCETPFYLDPLFENDTRICRGCGTRLAEWNLMRFMILIDVDRAPSLIQAMVTHIKLIGANEGFNQLWDMLNMFGIKME